MGLFFLRILKNLINVRVALLCIVNGIFLVFVKVSELCVGCCVFFRRG